MMRPTFSARLLAFLSLLTLSAAAAPVITNTKDDGETATTRKAPGSTVTYTNKVKNTGDASASGVTFIDPDITDANYVANSLKATAMANDDTFPLTVLANTSIDSAASGYSVVTNDFTGYTGGLPIATSAITITAYDVASVNGGVVTMETVTNAAATPPTQAGRFTYTPKAGFTGTDTFNYTISNGIAGADAASLTGKVTVTVGGPVVWYVSNSGSDTNGTGTLAKPFATLAKVSTVDAANQSIYVGSGTYTSGFTLKSGQKLFGQGASGASFDAVVLGGTPAAGTPARPAIGGTKPILRAASGNTLVLNQGNTISGFLIDSTIAGYAITGNAINTTTIGVAGDTVISTSGSSSGALSLTGVGNGNITVDPFINVNSGKSVTISGRTGGTVTFARQITDNSGGIALNGNGGTTFKFNLVRLSTTGTNTAFSVVNSGTVELPDFTADGVDNDGDGAVDNDENNLATNATGGAAVEITGTTIGTAGVTFRSVISIGTGTTPGITLRNTGAGSFTIKGAPGNAINGSGGTISGKTGTTLATGTPGILLENVSNVRLNNLAISNNRHSGIYGNRVNGLLLSNSLISGNGDDLVSGPDETGVDLTELTGTAANGSNPTVIQNCIIRNNKEIELQVTNTTGTLTDFRVLGCTLFSNNADTANPHGNLFNFVANGTAVMALTMTDGILTGHGSTATTGTALQVDANGGSMAVNVTTSTFTDNNSGVSLSASGTGNLTFDVLSSTITLNRSHGLNLFVAADSSGTVNGKFRGNVVGTQTIAGSGSNLGYGIRVQNESANTTKPVNLLIDGNTVQQTANLNSLNINQGIVGQSASRTTNATITNNAFRNSAARAIAVLQNNVAAAGATAVNIANNTFIAIAGQGADGTKIRLRRFASGSFSLTQATVGAFAAANNLTVSEVVVDGSPTYSGAPPTLPLIFTAGGIDAVAAEMQPREIAAVVESAAATVTELSPSPAAVAETPVADGLLQQAELDALVATAISRWEATGLSAEQVARLRGLHFEISSLNDNHLGEATGNCIHVDRAAGGNGWFVDAAAHDGDAAFATAKSATRLYTDATGNPAGRIDLLTTLMHEMGHALGLPDHYDPQDRENIMYGYLTKGERRLPAKDQAEGAIPHPGAVSHFLTGTLNPIAIGTVNPGKSVVISYSVQISSTVTAAQISSRSTATATGLADVPSSNTEGTTLGSGATVTLIGIPPVITSADTIVFVTGTSSTFQVTATGTPAPTTFGITGTLPTGITFTAAGVLSGNPGLAVIGTYPLTITTSNGVTPNASQSFTLVVRPPIDHFAVTAPTTATEGTGTTVRVTAQSAANANETGYRGTVQFTSTDTISGLPANYTFTAADNGVHDFTVTFNTGGSQTVSVKDTVIASAAGTSNAIAVTGVNDAPSFTKGPDVTVNEDSAAYSQAWATAISPGPSDESTQVVDFIVSNNNNALFVNQPSVSATGVLSFLPAANAFGSATVSVSLHDNGGTANNGVDTSAVQTFTITINAVNDVPVIDAIDNVAVATGSSLRVVNLAGIAAGAGETQILTVTAASNNTAVIPNPIVSYTSPAATGSLTFLPVAGQSGVATITVTVKDNGGTTLGGFDTTTRSFTVTVKPAANVVQSVATTSLNGSDGVVTPGEIITYQTSVTLSEGDNIPLRIIEQLPPGVAYVPGSVTLSTAAFNGTVASPTSAPAAGTTYLDGTDVLLDFAPITVVRDLNPSNNTFTITYQAVVLDVPSNVGLLPTPVTLTKTGSADISAARDEPVAMTGTGAVLVKEPELKVTQTLSPASGDAAQTVTATVVIEHTANSTLAAQDLLPTTVFPAGFTYQAGSFTALKGATNIAASFTANAAGISSAGVADLALGQSITLTFQLKPTTGTALGTAITNLFSLAYDSYPGSRFVPIFNASGDVNTDRQRGYTTSDSDTFTVGSVLLSKTSIDENNSANAVVGLLSATTTAVPGPAPTFTLVTGTGSTDNNAFSISGNQLLLLAAADFETKASYSIRLRSDDGAGLVFETAFTITINNVNEAPTLAAISNLTVNEDASASSVVLTVADAETAVNQLTFLMSSSVPGLVSNLTTSFSEGSHRLSITPAPNAFGTATITVTVQDAGGLTAAQSLTYTVNAVNDAPSFTPGGNVTVLEDAGAQTITAWATNFSAGPANESSQTLTANVTNNNNALFSVQPSLNPANGNLTFTPAADKNGSATVSVQIQDDGGTANNGVNTSGVQTFTITVTAVNDVPTLAAIANPATLPVNSGAQTVNLTGISAGPEETQTLTVTAISSNPSLVPNPAVTYTSPAATGSLSFTPVTNQSGTATITVTVKDNGGITDNGVDTVTRSFTVTVNRGVYLTSTLNAGDDTADEAGDNGVFTFVRTDSAGDLTVNFTLDASSTADPSDYSLAGPGVSYDATSGTGTVTFANGETTRAVTLTAIPETIQSAEPEKTVRLNLVAGTGYDFGSPTNATVTLKQNGFIVTNTDDTGEGSLRQAILNANALPGADLITFQGPIFTDTTPDVIDVASGQLTVSSDITLSGPGANLLTLRNTAAIGAESRVFLINGGVSTIKGVKITGANVNNTGSGGAGIRLTSPAQLSLINCAVVDNFITGFGAGIRNNGGTLNVIGCTISGNTAAGGYGAAIDNTGPLKVINSTISGNSATSNSSDASAGIFSETGPTFILNSTITNNLVGASGVTGVRRENGTVTIANSIIAGNQANVTKPEVTGTILSSGGNIIGNAGNATGFIASDILGTGANPIDPKLGPLADNGGPTPTHAILAGSPALNKGLAANVPLDTFDLDSDLNVTEPIPYDQRGVGFNRSVGSAPDAGAFELGKTISILALNASKAEGTGSTATPFTFTVSRVGDTVGIATVTYTVTGSGGNPATAVDFGGTLPTGTFTIPDGAASATLTINVTADTLLENNEGFTITLTDPLAPYVIETATATGSITDDDSATLSIGKINDGAETNPAATNGLFRVSQSAASITPTVVNYSVAGTATSGNDFTALSGSVTIAAGATTADIVVPVIRDFTVEPTETVIVTLTSISSAHPQVSLGTPASATLDIVDSAPASVAVSSGSPQTNTVNNIAGARFVAIVKDAAGNNLQGASVTFTAPASGASGSFDGTATVVTNSSGLATAPAFTTNTVAGSYQVTAEISGVITPAVFTLTNAPAAATNFAVVAPDNAIAGQAANFTVTAFDTFGNVATGYAGTVRFNSSDAIATLPANSTLTAGTGTFSASFKTGGNQTITATDTAAPAITGTSNPIAVSPRADLSVIVSGNPTTVDAGANLTYTLTVANNGPSAAASVALNDTLPAGTTFVSLVTPAGWSATTPAVGSAGTVSASIANLPTGSSVFTLTVKVDYIANGTVLSNIASASSVTGDPVPANNSGTATTTVRAIPEIAVYDGPTTGGVELTDSGPLTVLFGNTTVGVPVSHTFTVKNAGTGPLLLSSINLPTGFSLPVAFTAQTIAPTASFSFAVRYDAPTVGTSAGTLQIASNDSDEAIFDISISGTRTNVPPVVPVIVTATDEDVAKTITLTATDGDNDPLTFFIVDQPQHGTLSGTLPNVVYTPNLNYNGPDNFTFKANDGTVNSGGTGEVQLTVNAVNDVPTVVGTGIADIVQTRTGIWNVIDLADYFTDVETPSSALTYTIGIQTVTDAPVTPIAHYTLNGTVLSISGSYPGGVAYVSITATDPQNGQGHDFFYLSTKHIPEVAGSGIPDTLLSPASPGLEIDLANYFLDGDNDPLTYVVSSNSAPTKVSTTVNGSKLTLKPLGSGTSTLTILTTDSDGNTVEDTFIVTVEEPVPTLQTPTPGTVAHLNRQTGLWEISVTATNANQFDVPGFRLRVTSALPAGITLHNSTGPAGSFAPYFDVLTRTAPGQSVTVIMEFHSATRNFDGFNPTIIAEPLPAGISDAGTGAGIAVTLFKVLPDRSILLEFTSVPGGFYQIEYSSDMMTWKKSLVPIQSGANRVQWIDRGAPYTDAHPSTLPARFYRVSRIINN